jgi:AcrR family transcriptional regulator
MTHRADIDRRRQRTRDALHHALASLVHEKSYDDVVVRDILGRAQVARSTFYAHYRDKADVAVVALVDRVRPAPPLQPPLPRARRGLARAGAARDDSRDAAAVHDHLRRVLERELARELGAERRRRTLAGDTPFPVDLLARHLAATFVLVLDWWLAHPAHPAHPALPRATSTHASVRWLLPPCAPRSAPSASRPPLGVRHQRNVIPRRAAASRMVHVESLF